MKKGNNKGFWQFFAFLYAPFMRRNKKAYEEMCGMLASHVDENTHVLELACGTGQLSFPMAERSAHWTATDFSENMIREAEKLNMLRQEKLTFSVADATALSFADGSFDLVVIANALHIMPEPEKALSEIRRVLKENGTLFAPVFIYPGKKTGLLIRLMEMIGFKTYHKWNEAEYRAFVQANGFPDAVSRCIPAKPMPECILTAVKRGK